MSDDAEYFVFQHSVIAQTQFAKRLLVSGFSLGEQLVVR
jgi:hypothetical protein